MRIRTSLFEADDFAGDWYGWATNQISHIALGVFLVFLICMFGFVVADEMPYKGAVYALILFGYVAFELAAQGWRGWDTVEDTVFTAGYGAGGTLAGFSEVSAGSPMVAVDVVGLAPFFTMAVVHLTAGALYRR